MRLKNKVAVVTGASSGIGLAIAQRFIEEGATVVLSDVSEESGKAAAESLGGMASFVCTDVSKSDEVNSLVAGAVEKFGKIDVMVNNAGVGGLGNAMTATDEAWAKTIGINLSGVFYGVRAAANAMKEKGIKGSIINMSSILGTVGFAEAIAYCSAKGGVTNMTRAAALDLAQYGIRVNSIAPGFITTAMTKDILEDPGFGGMIKASTPLGYVGKPEDIANAAVYLAEDASGYVTGTIQHVDGGWTAK